MGSVIGPTLGLGQQNANNPGVDYGGLSGILSKMDPLGNKITQLGGDPLNLYGHKNNPNALLFPGGQNPLGNVPSVLPNLGAQSMMPQMPQGGFMPLGQTNPMGGQTPGNFNQMSAQSAGQLFSPIANKGGMPPIQQPVSQIGQGLMGHALGNFNEQFHPMRGFQLR